MEYANFICKYAKSVEYAISVNTLFHLQTHL